MYGQIYAKLRNNLPYTNNIADSVIARIIYECFSRMEMLSMDKSTLLDNNVRITINNETGEIDIRHNVPFGIFWSFDVETGELVAT